jgi:D-amino-acid dehydrogenase
MPKNRVLIIGAGVAGISAAYYLNKAGLEVIVLDKENGRDNCSYGNAGMIVPSHIIPLASPGMIRKGLRWMLKADSPFYIRPRINMELFDWGWKFRKSSTEKHVQESGPVLRDLLLRSRELLIEIEEQENLEFHYKKKGLFMFCNTQKGLDSEAKVAGKAQKLGIPAAVLTADEVRSKEPGFNFNITGATYFPLDAHLHPESLINGLKYLLNSRGVRFIYDTEISQFGSDSTKITNALSNDGQMWEADYFIISGGAWSAGLAKTAGLRIPLQAGKGYSITLNDPPRLPEHCGILAEAKVTMTPMYNTLRFGGTMEIVGIDKRVNRKKMSGLKKSVCNYLPQFKMTHLDTENIWVGLRPCSPDGMPYVGSANKYDNLYVSTGHAMMGMSLAPASGQIISDLISKGHSDLYHHKIDPNRYE